MNANATVERVADANVVRGIKVIDIDSHLSEPLDLWTSRATPKYRDRVPQMRMLDGQWVWTIDGNRSMGVGSASSVIYRDGSKAAGIEFSKWQVDEVHPGCSRVKERLEFMDENGIWAQIVYPNVLGFAGQGRAPMGARRSTPTCVSSARGSTTTPWRRCRPSRAAGSCRWRCFPGGTSTSPSRRR